MPVDLLSAESLAADPGVRSPSPRAHRRRGPWARLLSEVLDLAGPHAQFVRHSERPWSSATFSGARHGIVVSFRGAEATAHGETFIAALPDHEFTVPGHLVADATVIAVEHAQLPEPGMTVEAELLLLEEA